VVGESVYDVFYERVTDAEERLVLHLERALEAVLKEVE
jgi:hypothetical protein